MYYIEFQSRVAKAGKWIKGVGEFGTLEEAKTEARSTLSSPAVLASRIVKITTEVVWEEAD